MIEQEEKEDEEQKQPLQEENKENEENNSNGNQDDNKMIIPDGAENIGNNEGIGKLFIEGDKAGIRGKIPLNMNVDQGNNFNLFQRTMLSEEDRNIYPFSCFGVIINEDDEAIATACLISSNMAITSSDKIKPFSKSKRQINQSVRQQDNQSDSSQLKAEELPNEQEGKDVIDQPQDNQRLEEEQKSDNINNQQYQENTIKNQNTQGDEGEVGKIDRSQEDSDNLQQQQQQQEQPDQQQNQIKQPYQGILRFVSCRDYQGCFILSVKIINDTLPGIAVLELSIPFGDQVGWLSAVANSKTEIYNICLSTTPLIIFGFNEQNEEFIQTNLGLEVDKFKNQLTVDSTIPNNSLLFTFDPVYNYSLVGFSCLTTQLRTTYNIFNNSILQNLQTALVDNDQRYQFCPTQSYPKKYLPNRFELQSKMIAFNQQLEIEQQNKTLSAVTALVRVNENCLACGHKKGWLSVFDWKNELQLLSYNINSLKQQGNEQGISSDQINQEKQQETIENSFIGLITRGKFLFCLLERTIVCYSWLNRQEQCRVSIDFVQHSCTKIPQLSQQGDSQNQINNKNSIDFDQKQKLNQNTTNEEELQFQAELLTQNEQSEIQNVTSSDNTSQNAVKDPNVNQNDLPNNTHQNHNNPCTFTCFCIDEEDYSLFVGCSSGCLLKFIYLQSYQQIFFQCEIANFSQQSSVQVENPGKDVSTTSIVEIVQIFKQTKKYPSSYLIGLSSGEIKILTNDQINQTGVSTVLASKERQDISLKQLLLFEDRTRVLSVSQYGYAVFSISHDDNSNVILQQKKQVPIEQPIVKVMLLNNDEIAVVFDKNLVIYNVKNNTEMQEFPQISPISSMGILNSEGFISGDEEGLIKIWVLLFDQDSKNINTKQPKKQILDVIIEDLEEGSAIHPESKQWSFSILESSGIYEEQKSQLKKEEVIDEGNNETGVDLSNQIERKNDDNGDDVDDNNQEKEATENDIEKEQNLNQNNSVLSQGPQNQRDVKMIEENQQNDIEIVNPKTEEDTQLEMKKSEEQELNEIEQYQNIEKIIKKIDENLKPKKEEDILDNHDSVGKIQKQQNDQIEVDVKVDIIENNKSQQSNEIIEKEIINEKAKTEHTDIIIDSQNLQNLLKLEEEKQNNILNSNNQGYKLKKEEKGSLHNQKLEEAEIKDNEDKKQINGSRYSQTKEQKVFVQQQVEINTDKNNTIKDIKASQTKEIPENIQNQQPLQTFEQQIPSRLVQCNSSQEEFEQYLPGFESIYESLRILTNEIDRLNKEILQLVGHYFLEETISIIFLPRLSDKLSAALQIIQSLISFVTEIQSNNTNIYHIPEESQQFKTFQKNCQPLLINRNEQEMILNINLTKKNDQLNQIIRDMQIQLEIYQQQQLNSYQNSSSQVKIISTIQQHTSHTTSTSTPTKLIQDYSDEKDIQRAREEKKQQLFDNPTRQLQTQQQLNYNKTTHVHDQKDAQRILENNSSDQFKYPIKHRCQRHQQNKSMYNLLPLSSPIEQQPHDYQSPFKSSVSQASMNSWNDRNLQNSSDAKYNQNKEIQKGCNSYTPEKTQGLILPSKSQKTHYLNNSDNLVFNEYQTDLLMNSSFGQNSYNSPSEKQQQLNKSRNSYETYSHLSQSPINKITYITSDQQPPQPPKFIQKQYLRQNN